MSDESVTYDELALIGWNVCNLVASMQMAGHNNPVHTLDYRHGPKAPEVQFVEDFARVCNKGGTRASDEYDRCGICGVHQRFESKQLALDHDHRTGLIRGLLCTGCNLREGWEPYRAFGLWRNGMNPCRIFGWNYYYQGPGFAPEPLSDDEVALEVRRALVQDLQAKHEAREAMRKLGNFLAPATT